MDRAETAVGLDRVQPGHPFQQIRELVLSGLGQQEVVEGMEAASLVGSGDVGSAAHELGQELALRSVPARDLLPRRTVQDAEVVLDLTEVAEQLTCGRGELLVAIAHCRVVEDGNVPSFGGSNLRVELVAPP